MREMKLKELKQKSPTELLAFAEENEVENASTMRKQELMFAILKQLASVEVQIIGEGVVEILDMDSPSCGRPTPTISPVPTISMYRHHNSGGWGCARAIRSRGSSEVPKKANAISAAEMQRNQF